MKIIKIIVLILIFFLGMLFFVQNQDALHNPLSLKFDFFSIFSWESKDPVPVYQVIVYAFTLGMLFIAAFFTLNYPLLLIKKYYFSRQYNSLSVTNKRLNKQVSSLKTELNNCVNSSEELKKSNDNLQKELLDSKKESDSLKKELSKLKK